MSKKTVIPIPVSKPVQSVIRVGQEIMYRILSIDDYGKDGQGPFAVVTFGDAYPADERMCVRSIDLATESDEVDRIIFSPTYVPDPPQPELGEKVGREFQTPMPGLWSDQDQREQESRALQIVREIEMHEEDLKQYSTEKRTHIKSLKLQLRSLAHGAFPAEPEQPLFEEMPEKVDPSKLPSPKKLSGDELSRRIANFLGKDVMHRDGGGRDTPAVIDGQAVEVTRTEMGKKAPGKRRAPINIDRVTMPESHGGVASGVDPEVAAAMRDETRRGGKRDMTHG